MSHDLREIAVYAPASVSNFGPGFDCFGLALERPGDTVSARLADVPGVRVESIEGLCDGIPLDSDRNTASVAAAAVWSSVEDPPAPGLILRIHKGVPPGSGLGSSGASAAAGAAVAGHLYQELTSRSIDDRVIFEAALDGEAVAAGTRHADNVAPSLFGDFVIVRRGEPTQFARFHPKLECWIAVVKPDISISTREAREVLPETVPLSDAVTNWSNSATLVLGLLQGDAELVKESLHDSIVEPRRAKLIPGFDDAREAALGAGALACGVSGSGPTLFALATEESVAKAAARSITKVFRVGGLDSWIEVSPISPLGARRV
ncbi:MAG: homoserine kinase [Planctomycetota bacterium]|nr:homoserine kinase [Planctomycetota bacterium]